MADRYAPALLLDVLAFWFVLRWFLSAAAVLFVGRLLIGIMVIGVLGTLDQHHYTWAAFFAGSAVLAWQLLRHWRNPRARGQRTSPRHSFGRPWRRTAPDAAAMLCERRIGVRVDAAVPAILATSPDAACVLALAGDALWVLDDESSSTRPAVGRVLARWARQDLVSHVELVKHTQQLELSWPHHGALMRGLMPAGPLGDAFAGQLIADELARPRK